MRRRIYIAVLTFLVGAYLTIPTFLFNGGERVVVLGRPDIDKLGSLNREFNKVLDTYINIESREPPDKEVRQKLLAIEVECYEIEAGGKKGYRLRCQEVFYRRPYGRYQEPHVVRSIFPWVAHFGDIFDIDTDEYLGWLWFTIICINIAYYIHSKVRARWKDSPQVVASSRWVFFCLCAMGASMILIAFLDYRVELSFISVASRVLSGPAYVFVEYVYRISGCIWETLILYSAIQWVLIGGLGCLVLRRLKGRYLAWGILSALAICAVLGLAVADAIQH